jgi:hypothetical protein
MILLTQSVVFNSRVYRLSFLFKTVLFGSLLLSGLCGSGCTSESEDNTMTQRVGINTLRDPFHKSDTSCGPYPSYYLEYLDDTQCTKMLPSHRDRSFQCPTQTSSDWFDQSPAYTPVTSSTPSIEVDSMALRNYVPKDVSVTLILVRRVDGVPYYRYLSNGTHDQIVETWSSSKFLGIMNASEGLRYSSDGQLGLDAYVDQIPVGDLVSVVHSYDERIYTSNGLMSWFHDIGGRFFANQLMHERWLNRPETEIYGANYGQASSKIGFTFAKDEKTTEIKPDQGWIKNNRLSTFTLAESLKRLVMYRENPETQLEYSTWDDIKVLLYGAQESIWYDQRTPQGMEGDVSVYLQQAVDLDQIEENTQGQWRIFSKLGLGFSRGGEIVHTDYACLPLFDQEGQPVVNQGVEMILSIHLPLHDQYAQGDQILADLYTQIVQAVLKGDLK